MVDVLSCPENELRLQEPSGTSIDTLDVSANAPRHASSTQQHPSLSPNNVGGRPSLLSDGYLSLSLESLSRWPRGCCVRVLADSSRLRLLDEVCACKHGEGKASPDKLSVWMVAARSLGLTSKSAGLWRHLFFYFFQRMDWRGLCQLARRLPLEESFSTAWQSKVRECCCCRLQTATLGHEDSGGAHQGEVCRGRLFSSRLLRSLQLLQQSGGSMFPREVLLQTLAQRGVFLEAGQGPKSLALLLQRLAKTRQLFCFSGDASEPLQSSLRSSLLPRGRLSELHLFVLNLALSNKLPSVLLAYLQVRCQRLPTNPLSENL